MYLIHEHTYVYASHYPIYMHTNVGPIHVSIAEKCSKEQPSSMTEAAMLLL